MELLSGTNELKKVLKEVERRKEEAVNAGLDRLFLDAYHRSIRHYPVWIKNQTQRRYVHPDVSNPTAIWSDVLDTFRDIGAIASQIIDTDTISIEDRVLAADARVGDVEKTR